MAERSLSVTTVASGTGAKLIAWTGLLNGDTGAPLSLPDYADLTATFEGTFGAGGTILLEGSLDGVNYITLTDPQGTSISKTAASIESVVEAPRYIRPRVSAGDGTTNLQCRIMARRGSR